MRSAPFLMVIFLLLSFSIISCTKKHDRADITATVYPYYLIVNEIAGDDFNVKCLIPQNASPHTYSPAPSDILMLEQSGFIIANGYHLEENILRKLYEYEDKLLLIENILDKSFLIESIHEHHHEHAEKEEENEESINPHVWFNVKAVELIIDTICERLKLMNPVNAYKYEENALKMKNEINEFTIKAKDELKQYKTKKVITYHNAFEYFLNEFDIELVDVVEEFAGRDVSLKNLTEIALKIKNNDIKTIFIEPQLNPKSAEVLAKEYSLKIDTLDPLGYWIDAKSIVELFEYNFNKMKKSFL